MRESVMLRDAPLFTRACHFRKSLTAVSADTHHCCQIVRSGLSNLMMRMRSNREQRCCSVFLFDYPSFPNPVCCTITFLKHG